MSLVSFNGIPKVAAQSMYSKTKSSNRGDEYILDSSRKGAELHKLDEKLRLGDISESRYETEKAAIESAPRVIHIDAGSSVPESSPLKEQSNPGFSSEDELIKVQKEIASLRNQYLNGDISEFAYKANMYLLTNPMPQDNHQIDITA